MTLLYAVECEGCSSATTEPTWCGHFDLCPDCFTDDRCQICRREAQDERDYFDRD